MNQYTAKMYKKSFNQYVDYIGSNVAHSYNSGTQDSNTFGSSSSSLSSNTNNPLNMAIIVQGDDKFNNIITTQGISDDMQAIALMKKEDLVLLPYSLEELSKSSGDKLVEVDLSLKYKISDYAFFKKSKYLIGIMFILNKV